jgi:hypothetical protein
MGSSSRLMKVPGSPPIHSSIHLSIHSSIHRSIALPQTQALNLYERAGELGSTEAWRNLAST